MTKKEARKLAKEIESQGYTAKLHGYIGSDIVILRVTDHTTGYTMIIESPEDWADRCREAELYNNQ